MKKLYEIDILELIPQRLPFVMVDRLVAYDEVLCECEFLVCEDNIFCKNGYFSSYGVIENIAQSCAARIGYKSLLEGKGITLGFIGAIKDLQILARVSVGDRIRTQIEVLTEVFSMTLVEARSYCNGEMVCRCQMKISLSDIEV